MESLKLGFSQILRLKTSKESLFNVESPLLSEILARPGVMVVDLRSLAFDKECTLADSGFQPVSVLPV